MRAWEAQVVEGNPEYLDRPARGLCALSLNRASGTSMKVPAVTSLPGHMARAAKQRVFASTGGWKRPTGVMRG